MVASVEGCAAYQPTTALTASVASLTAPITGTAESRQSLRSHSRATARAVEFWLSGSSACGAMLLTTLTWRLMGLYETAVDDAVTPSTMAPFLSSSIAQVTCVFAGMRRGSLGYQMPLT